MTASSEIKSEHPIAQTIVKKAKEEKIALLEASEFDTMIGHGIRLNITKKGYWLLIHVQTKTC